MRSRPLDYLAELASSGDMVDFSIRGQPAVLVNDPLVIERVLVTEQPKFVKPPALQRATRLLGQGLLTAPEPLHQGRRSLVQPGFHRQRLNGYESIMIARAASLRDTWQSGGHVDISVEMSDLALSIVGETLFTADLTAHAATLRDIVARAIDVFDPIVTLVAPMRRLRPARQRLDAIVDDLIAQRLNAEGEPQDLLHMLLAAEPADTSEQLHDDVLTLLLAGFDTISNALTWTWMFLADHPDVDEALGEEIVRVLGPRAPTVADLSMLLYAKSVFAESLRLRPPAWVIARLAAEPLHLATHEIPAGTLVLMSPYVTQRDPRFFPDPLAFRPARWLAASETIPRHRFSYFPFGAGRRSCIGEGFALMEGVLVLATLAPRWRLRTIGRPTDVDARITLRPRGPVLMMADARV